MRLHCRLAGWPGSGSLGRRAAAMARVGRGFPRDLFP